MIVTRLRAAGFMRYARIDIQDLPPRGIVAVLGDNESGKSTLGECVAFALFGESIKSRATDLSQVVSWDAERCEVEIDFELAGGRRFALERRVDKRGAHEALLRAEGGREEARGPEAVERRLAELTGLGFDTFRASFYLGQQELDLFRRADDGEGRRVVEEVLGIAALERAARGLREELRDLGDRHRELDRELAVARAIAAAGAVDPGAAAALEEEALRCEAERRDAAARLPAARGYAAAVRDAGAARAAAGNAFNALGRAVAARAAGRELARLSGQLLALRSGLEAEHAERGAALAAARRDAEEVRRRIDRLIDYRTRMAQLEARLELYRNEVRRSLEAPKVEAEDLAALEGIAMPSTPAAGAQLAEARVARVRRTRNRAGWRAIIFFTLGLLCSFIAFPALSRLVSEGAVGPRINRVAEDLARSEAVSGLQQIANGIERALGALGVAASNKTWAALAIGGSLGLGFGVLLGSLAIAQWRSRNDALKLSTEARERIQGEVEALRAELAALEGLTLAKPIDFGERVRALRNPVLRDLFAELRLVHDDFLGATEQGDALVKLEREGEARARETTAALEERMARLARLLRVLPPADDLAALIAGEGRPGTLSVPAPTPVPEALDGLEAEVDALVERYERAERELREAHRGGERAEPEPLLEALRAELGRVLAVSTSPPPEPSALDALLDQALAGLYRTVDDSSELDPASLERRLDAESDKLDHAMPGAARLLVLRDEAERAERAEQERLSVAEGRLDALRERLADARARLAAHRERAARVEALAAEAEPLGRLVAVRALAADLLDETAEALRGRAGPMLAGFAQALLPRLTGGRYRKVQVSPRLDIKVYSPDKNDYVPLGDLSMGAADQLLLALRLGLGLALVAARGLGAERHFLFLDEPLASFDQGRARAFLHLLAEHGEVFPQVFLVAHNDLSGLSELFARVIRTRLDRRALLSPEPAESEERGEGAEGDAVASARTEADLPADSDLAGDIADTDFVEPTLLLPLEDLPSDEGGAASGEGAGAAAEGALAPAARGEAAARAKRRAKDVEAFADLQELPGS